MLGEVAGDAKLFGDTADGKPVALVEVGLRAQDRRVEAQAVRVDIGASLTPPEGAD